MREQNNPVTLVKENAGMAPRLCTFTGADVVNVLHELKGVETATSERECQSINEFVEQNASDIPNRLLTRIDEERKKGNLSLEEELSASGIVQEQRTKEITELVKAKASADRMQARSRRDKLIGAGIAAAGFGCGINLVSKAISARRIKSK